jgi:hypothetical protein
MRKMNGIINKSLIALFLLGETVVADGGGLEYGWTQLPDGRVEYIIQLDDKAIEALKNGQPLTSSLPPEVRTADRIRIQYGTGEVAKPVLLRKPQGFNPYPPANSTLQGYGGDPSNNSVRSTSVADSVPYLPLNNIRPTGSIETTSGNQKVVSNSSLSAVRQTSYIAPQQGQGDRELQNYDEFNGTRVGESRGVNPNPNYGAVGSTTDVGGTNPNYALNPPVVPANTGVGTGNNGASSYQPGSLAGVPDIGNPNPSNGMAAVPRRDMRSATARNWTGVNTGQGSVFPPSNGIYPPSSGTYPPSNGTGAGDPNYGAGNSGFPNAGQGTGNPNYQPPNPNYGQPGGTYNPTIPAQPVSGQGPYPYPPNYVATPVPSNPNVDSLTKQIEELQNQAKEKDQRDLIAKLEEAAKKDKEENQKLLQAMQKQLDDKSKNQGNQTREDRVTPVVNNGVTPVSNVGSASGSGNSTAITIFLLFSIGLNVFLVIQYLSVQNQFRDLSNDLRDSFMANNYE